MERTLYDEYHDWVVSNYDNNRELFNNNIKIIFKQNKCKVPLKRGSKNFKWSYSSSELEKQFTEIALSNQIDKSKLKGNPNNKELFEKCIDNYMFYIDKMREFGLSVPVIQRLIIT